MRLSVPGITEEEVMHEYDLDWIGATLHRIDSESMRLRRERFMDALMAAGLAFSGGEHVEQRIRSYLMSLMTSFEQEELEEAEKASMRAEAERRGAQLMAAFAAGNSVKGVSIGGAKDQAAAKSEWVPG